MVALYCRCIVATHSLSLFSYSGESMSSWHTMLGTSGTVQIAFGDVVGRSGLELLLVGGGYIAMDEKRHPRSGDVVIR